MSVGQYVVGSVNLFLQIYNPNLRRSAYFHVPPFIWKIAQNEIFQWCYPCIEKFKDVKNAKSFFVHYRVNRLMIRLAL